MAYESANQVGVDTREATVWLLGLIAFVFGDIITTAIGFQVGLVESNALPLLIFESIPMMPAMAVLKVIAVGFGVALYYKAPPTWRIGVPLGYLVVGAGVTGYNLALIIHVI